MTEQLLEAAPPLSVEDGINTVLRKAQEALRHGYQGCEQHVQKSPTTSVLVAVAAGYCLHRLPVRGILVAQVRLLAALAPPAFFLFGAAKFCEFLQNQAADKGE